MKRITVLILGVLLLSISIAGCSTTGQTEDVAAPLSSTPEPTAAAPASEETPAVNESAAEQTSLTELTDTPVETEPVAVITAIPSTLTAEEKEFSEWITRTSNLVIPAIDHSVAISNIPYEELNTTELSESSSYLGGMATYYFDELEHMDYPKKFTSVRNKFRSFLYKAEEGARYLVKAAEKAEDNDRAHFAGYRSPANNVLEEAKNYQKLAMQYLEEKSASNV